MNILKITRTNGFAHIILFLSSTYACNTCKLYFAFRNKRLYATDKKINHMDMDYFKNTELEKEKTRKPPKYYQPCGSK